VARTQGSKNRPGSRILVARKPVCQIMSANSTIPNSTPKPSIGIRDLETIRDIEAVLRLEKEVWDFEDVDVTPLTLAVAMKAAGSILVGAFDGSELVGFAFAFPSLEHGRVGFHSHTLAVRPSYQSLGLGYRLKLAQRQRALALGIKEVSWTFDPLRSRNAHLNFSRLGVVSDSYKVNFYGVQTTSPLHTNSTDRFWVTWHLADTRVEERIKGKDFRPEIIDALAHVEPLVRFNGDGKPAEGVLASALSRQRVAIEIPGDMDRIERDQQDLGRQWRMATRRAFSESLKAGFIVKEFCRFIRGQQGPGAYLLEKDS
jgi:predicted GNAT superfamily acetyltransferase